MTEATTGQIGTHTYTIVPARKIHLHSTQKGRSRYVVAGATTAGPRKGKASRHSGGKTIKYKSFAAMESDLKNRKML